MLKRDSALRVIVEKYPQTSIFHYFALMKVIEDKRLWAKEVRKKGDLNKICESVTANTLPPAS